MDDIRDMKNAYFTLTRAQEYLAEHFNRIGWTLSAREAFEILGEPKWSIRHQLQDAGLYYWERFNPVYKPRSLNG